MTTTKYIPKRNEKNRTVSLSMPKELHKAIKERADRERRSFSSMVAILLEEEVAAYNKQNPMRMVAEEKTVYTYTPKADPDAPDAGTKTTGEETATP